MYLFYIDETGSLDTETQSVRSDGTVLEKDWLYTLTAVGLFEHRWRQFYHPIILKKRQLIQEIRRRQGVELTLSQCEVKSNWIRISSERAEKPFLGRLTEEELNQLVEIYYEQLFRIPSILLSVVVDKRFLQPHMDRAKLHRKSWELLCERIDLCMHEFHPKHRAVLLTDDVSTQANISLAEKHAYFLEWGTSSGCRFRHIIEMPLFVRSELSEGIQLADLCSYSIYHAFRYNKPDYPYFTRLKALLYNSSNTAPNKLDGLKIFPDSSGLTGLLRERE